MALVLWSCAGNSTLNTEAIDSFTVDNRINQIDPVSAKNTCQAIALDLTNNDMQSLQNRIDVIPILASIFTSINNHPLTLEQRLKIKNNLNDQIKMMLTPNVEAQYWAMRRGKIDGDSYKCLLRTNASRVEIRYLEFTLRQIDGTPHIVDLSYPDRNLLASEIYTVLLTDYIELLYTVNNAYEDQRPIAQQELGRLTAFLKQLNHSNPQRLLIIFEGLPVQIKSKPEYIQLMTAFASTMDRSSYLSFLTKSESTLFYKHDQYGMLLKDLYYMRNEYDKVEQVLHQLEERVGSDPYIDIELAKLENIQGNSRGFYSYCLKALDRDPDFLDTYSLLLENFVYTDRHQDAVLVLDVLLNRLNKTLKLNACTSTEKYRNFCSSPAYLAWKSKN
jgi:hypothetical protein